MLITINFRYRKQSRRSNHDVVVEIADGYFIGKNGGLAIGIRWNNHLASKQVNTAISIKRITQIAY